MGHGAALRIRKSKAVCAEPHATGQDFLTP